MTNTNSEIAPEDAEQNSEVHINLAPEIFDRIRNKIPQYPNPAIQPLVDGIACYCDWVGLPIKKATIDNIMKALPDDIDVNSSAGSDRIDKEVHIEQIKQKILHLESIIEILEKIWKIAMFIFVTSLDTLGLSTKQVLLDTAFSNDSSKQKYFSSIFDWSLVAINFLVGLGSVLLSFPIRDKKNQIKTLLKEANKYGAGDRPFFIARKNKYSEDATQSYLYFFQKAKPPIDVDDERSPLLDGQPRTRVLSIQTNVK